jgi:2-polyprenyl-3-methyl-5-hydroxy-6-metoxy-1,4-benzoquinol methylase
MATANLTTEALEQLRQHFNRAPYPNVALESVPCEADQLYIHNLTTAIYRRDQRVVSSVGKVILDAGCGTGYKSHMLAIANPGATIVGIDLSEDSVVMARQRFTYHQIEPAEFHSMPLERIGELGIQFDYINCDDVLYLLPDAGEALQAMRSVLKPDGIIRVNFHSETGRKLFLAAQNFFKLLGCMQGAPQASEIELVRQTMQAMKPNVTLGQKWGPAYLEQDERVLANYLLQNDKSWSIHQFFAALRIADLEFISMVDWWSWNLIDLFNDIEELPFEVVMQLSDLSIEDQLALYESINVTHRLLDILCGHPDRAIDYIPVEDWAEQTWYSAHVHFHPQLLSEDFRNYLTNSAATFKAVSIEGNLRKTRTELATIHLNHMIVGCLLPLLEGGQPFQDLLNRWIQLHPINPVTMLPFPPEAAYEPIQQTLVQLELMGYVMLEVREGAC